MISDWGSETVFCREYPEIDMYRQKKFLVKIIYRAICDYVNYKRSRSKNGKLMFAEARQWLYGPEPECLLPPENAPKCWTPKELRKAERSMSFEVICDILGWDTGWARKEIDKLTRADLKRIGKNGVL